MQTDSKSDIVNRSSQLKVPCNIPLININFAESEVTQCYCLLKCNILYSSRNFIYVSGERSASIVYPEDGSSGFLRKVVKLVADCMA